MTKLLPILLCSILLSAELEVDGNLKVTGTIQNDSLAHVIANQQQQISALETLITQLQAQINNLLTNGDCNEADPGIQFLDVCGICGGEAETDIDCNSALYFDGEDDYVIFDDSDDWTLGNTDFTISIWFLLNEYSSSGHEPLLGQNEDENGWILYLLANEIWFGSKLNGNWNEAHVPWIPQLNTRYNLVCVKNNESITFYVDGGLINNFPCNLPLPNLSGSLVFATYFPSDIDIFLNGKMDDVQIWHKEFSQQEIESNIFIETSGTEASLVGYWNFNNPGSNILHDHSGNENHGTIYGATWVGSE